MPDRLTPAQIRGARGMLNWSMLDLAQAARVSVSTVKRCEDADVAAVADVTLGAVREALEGRGIAFLADEGRAPACASTRPLARGRPCPPSS